MNKDLANVQKLDFKSKQICSNEMFSKAKEYEANQDQSDVDLVQILLLHISIWFWSWYSEVFYNLLLTKYNTIRKSILSTTCSSACHRHL